MKRGIFIVIDGADGCGKATQTKLLVEKLRELGFPVEQTDFPQYENNFFGKLIGQCQKDPELEFAKVNPYLEEDVEYQLNARESGIKMIQDHSWVKIQCSNDGIILRDREDIHNEILQQCLEILE